MYISIWSYISNECVFSQLRIYVAANNSRPFIVCPRVCHKMYTRNLPITNCELSWVYQISNGHMSSWRHLLAFVLTTPRYQTIQFWFKYTNYHLGFEKRLKLAERRFLWLVVNYLLKRFSMLIRVKTWCICRYTRKAYE